MMRKLEGIKQTRKELIFSAKGMDIHTALQLHSEPHIQCFLKSKANIDVKDICEQTPLHIASAQGMLDIVKVLLKKKANVNAKDSKGWTPLHCAANEQQYDVCLILIQHKANLNITTQDQASVLAYAAIGQRHPEKQTKVMDCIISKAPNLVHHSNCRNETPLNRACMSGSFEAIQLLLSHNGDINTQTVDGVSCLHNAVRSGRRDVVRYLLENKANPALKNKDGFTPEQEAFEFGDKDMAAFLSSLCGNQPAPEKRKSVVAELVNIFNKSNNDTLPPESLAKVVRATSNTSRQPNDLPKITKANNGRVQSSNESVVRSSPRRSSKHLSVEIRRESNLANTIDQPSSASTKPPYFILQRETEKLLQLLGEEQLDQLSNGAQISQQMDKLKRLLGSPNDNGNEKTRDSFTRTIIGRFSRNSNANTPVGSPVIEEKTSPKPRSSRLTGKSLKLETEEEESPTITPKLKSRKNRKQTVTATIGHIGKFIDETASNIPLTLSASSQTCNDDTNLSVDSFIENKMAQKYWKELHLPDARPMDILQLKHVPKDIRQRQLTFEEIMATETHYVRQLGAVVAFYIRPLENEMSHLISVDNVKTIFCNLESIFEISVRLLGRLTEEEAKEARHQCVGKIFHEFAHDFTQYTPYCTSQISAMETLECLQKENKTFEEFLYKTKEANEQITEDLNGDLIKPFQRICRYVMLLKELYKQTPPSWDDCTDLQKAIQSTDAVVSRANETQRVMDNLTKIQQIQDKLDIQLDLKRAVKFLGEGDVKEIEKGHAQKRHFFLFNSLLLVVKSGRGGKWINKYTVPVERCIVWNMPDTDGHKNCFQIVRTDSTDKIIFSCKTENDKENFMNAINEAISPNVFSLLC